MNIIDVDYGNGGGCGEPNADRNVEISEVNKNRGN